MEDEVKTSFPGLEKMAQRLKTLAALAEALGSVPTLAWWLWFQMT